MDYEPTRPTQRIAALLTEAISLARGEEMRDVFLVMVFAMERVKVTHSADG